MDIWCEARIFNYYLDELLVAKVQHRNVQRPFYRVPENPSCHGRYQWMQANNGIKLPWPRTREQHDNDSL